MFENGGSIVVDLLFMVALIYEFLCVFGSYFVVQYLVSCLVCNLLAE